MVEFNVDSIDKKYGALNKNLADRLRDYESRYFMEDKPVPFCGLHIYPIVVRDFEIFSVCVSCLTLNKNDDPKGVTMSHLDYLISKTQNKDGQKGVSWSFKIHKLFELIFHITNGLKCKNCGCVITYDSEEFTNFIQAAQLSLEDESSPTPRLLCPHCGGEDFLEMIKIIQDPSTNKYSLLVDGHTITKQDFADLRQIVMFQNFADYFDDSWVDPLVKQDRDEKIKLEQQKNDVHASIEKKVVCLSISTHYKFAEIYDMPIRKFSMALDAVDDLINYKITKQGVTSGFVSLPKGKTIEHWIYKPNKDIYGDSYKSSEEIAESVSNL